MGYPGLYTWHGRRGRHIAPHLEAFGSAAPVGHALTADVLYDSANGLFYVLTDNGVYKYVIATDTWTNLGVPAGGLCVSVARNAGIAGGTLLVLSSDKKTVYRWDGAAWVAALTMNGFPAQTLIQSGTDVAVGQIYSTSPSQPGVRITSDGSSFTQYSMSAVWTSDNYAQAVVPYGAGFPDMVALPRNDSLESDTPVRYTGGAWAAFDSSFANKYYSYFFEYENRIANDDFVIVARNNTDGGVYSTIRYQSGTPSVIRTPVALESVGVVDGVIYGFDIVAGSPGTLRRWVSGTTWEDLITFPENTTPGYRAFATYGHDLMFMSSTGLSRYVVGS